MLTFSNPAVTKALFVSMMEEHAAADRAAQGMPLDNNVGSLRGGAIRRGIEVINRLMGSNFGHKDTKSLSETLGIPAALLELEELIFGTLSTQDKVKWPVVFFGSIPENVDVEPAIDRILAPILREIPPPMIPSGDHPTVKAAIDGAVAVLQDGAASDPSAYHRGVRHGNC